MVECKKHQFNSGFVSAIAKFLAHRYQFQAKQHMHIASIKKDLRIYAASDHLFDINYPKNISTALKLRIKRFVSNVMSVRLANISIEEGDKLFNEADKILQEIDKQVFKLRHVCAKYS